MAWVSPKVFAILSSSEEGKDIIEKLPDLSQEECQAELDAFFGEGGKGASSGEAYGKAKSDDEAEERAYKEQGDKEVSEEDYEEGHDYELDALKERHEKGLDNDEGWEPGDDVTDEDISIALEDNSWSITDDDSVDSYSKLIADKLGIEQEKVLSVMEKEAGRKLDMKEQMAKLAFPDDSEPPADLDKSVYEQNYKQAYEINNYEKVKEIYDRQVQDKGADSPEAQGTKKALVEMEANFDKGENAESQKKDFEDFAKNHKNFNEALDLNRKMRGILSKIDNGEKLSKEEVEEWGKMLIQSKDLEEEITKDYDKKIGASSMMTPAGLIVRMLEEEEK